MEIVYLLVPLSVVLALLIIGVFAWAMHAGQFEDIEREGLRILEPDERNTGPKPVDTDQAGSRDQP